MLGQVEDAAVVDALDLLPAEREQELDVDCGLRVVGERGVRNDAELRARVLGAESGAALV